MKRFLILVLVLSVSFTVMARSPLTFEERVKAQEAIERVYYSHRIWPKENPQPKPSFEKMVPKESIEAKVTDYLKKCAALDQFWQRPIIASQLQAEMDRMAKGTKDPQILNELFAALNNDPYLIAECLARPVLADRLIHNWYANDERFHADGRAKAEEAAKVLTPENFCSYPEGQYNKMSYRLEIEEREELGEATPHGNSIKLDEKEFAKMQADIPEEGKVSEIQEKNDFFVITHTISKNEVEIEVESLSFQKTSFDEWWKETNTAFEQSDSADQTAEDIYSLPPTTEAACTEGWVRSGLNSFLDNRTLHSAVWTGSEMIVWGGEVTNGAQRNDGARYNPSTDTWTMTSTGTNCPTARAGHSAVWTGNEMIIWGGYTSNGPTTYYRTGGRYNPNTDSWTATRSDGTSAAIRAFHTAVWTGTEMIVWGGYYWVSGSGGGQINTGGRYTPSGNTWVLTSTGTNCPTIRQGHSAVWSGSEMIIWGGHNVNGFLNTGSRYTPSSNSWQAVSTGTNCPTKRENHTSIWTGSMMIVWGGSSTYYDQAPLSTGAQYDPLTDTWSTVSSETNCPSARSSHTAVWTGSKMIIWGGRTYISSTYNYFNIGGLYDPLTDSWTVTSADTNCPSARSGHRAVWTDSEMIIWGGNDKNTGARYNPGTDTWVPTSMGYDSSIGAAEKAVWTGNEMIVWGGASVVGGGRYNPVTDTWSTTSTGANVSSPRRSFSAVWTGTEMIVWGGITGSSTWTNTGGRYNAIKDSWKSTSTGINVPSARYEHCSVWTGTEMIVWAGAGNVGNTGGRYNPIDDTWTATSTGENCPSARRSWPSAVWTGSEMIVWGGSPATNTGGRYNPSSDSWIATSTEANCPSIRFGHTAVWTGTEMIIWAGSTSSPTTAYFNDGGRYNPSTDSWTPTSSTSLGVRADHTAVWTGTEMVVWGGTYYVSPNSYRLNTGGKYNPTTETWVPTSTGTDCPTPRYGHTAVWAGDEMIIWGVTGSGGIYYIPSSPIISANNIAIDASSCKDTGISIEWGNPVSWGDGRSGTRTFDVLRDGGTIATGLSSSTLSYVDTTGDNGVSYLYQIRANNGCGSSTTTEGTSAADVIDVYPTPSISGNTAGCSISGVTLSTGSFSTYQWNYEGEAIVGATSQSYQAFDSGNYSVTVSNEGDCSGTSSTHNVTVYSTPPVVSGDSSACTGSIITLSTGAYPSYQWHKDGVLIDGATGQTLDVSLPGTYSVFVDVPAGGCSGTSGGHVVQFADPPANPPVISGGSSNTCPATSVTLQTTEAFGTYQWYHNGNLIPGATGQTCSATLTGNYSVSAGAVPGCRLSSATHSVSISFCPPSEVSPKMAVYPASISKDSGSSTGYYLYFQKMDGSEGYNIYEGTLGSWYSHSGQPGNVCAATVTDLGTGEMRAEIAPSAGDHYYLVTAYSDAVEGPSGYNSVNSEIDPLLSSCGP